MKCDYEINDESSNSFLTSNYPARLIPIKIKWE